MKPLVIIATVLVLISGGCKKEDPTSEVIFSVLENSSATPAYNIEYTSDKGGGSTSTSNNTDHFSSDKIVLKQGQFVSMKVTCSDATYTLNLSIFVNGNLWKTGSLTNPNGSFTLSGELPAE